MESSLVRKVGIPRHEARVLTWNINGLRKVAAGHGGLKGLLDQFGADIVCFQEIKITRAGLVKHDLARARGYHCLFSHCKVHRKPAYSGVATFIRSECGIRTLASTTSLADAEFFGSPGEFSEGLSPERLGAIDSEGRVLVTNHGHFILFNVYAPCISSDKDDEKTEERRTFKRDFLALLKARIFQARESGRRVILVGDLNACASQLDHGYTITDANFFASNWSKWIRGMLGLDSSHPPRLVDCFRRLHPGRKDAFTCWNTQTGARENNYGTRIDYIIADAAFADRALQACDIMPDFFGSDHCPVRATFSVPFLAEGQTNCVADGVHGCGGKFEGAFGDVREWPEHPPECSCFYRELMGKQEKLGKYFFAAGSSRQDPAEDSQGEETSSSTGSDRTSPVFFSVGRGSDVRSTKAPSRGGISGSRGADRLGVQGRRGGAGGRLTNSRSGVRGRGVASGGARQSKLTFGSVGSASPSVSAAGKGTETTARGTAANGKAAGDHVVRGLRSDDGQQPSLSTTSDPHIVQSGTIKSVGDGSQEDGMPPEGGGVSTGGGACSGEGEPAVLENKKGDSAEAWKALFGNKKSAPPCEHGEPSIQRTVLKAGPNHSRRFYTCARSAGNWPIDRNARCNFFQWRLDGVRGYKDRPPRKASDKRQRRG